MAIAFVALKAAAIMFVANRVMAILAVIAGSLMFDYVEAGALERIKDTGQIKFGYLTNARPFSFKNDKDAPDGYAVALCERVAPSIARQLALPGLTITWKPIDPEHRLRAVRDKDIDLLCTPTSVTLDRREGISFSIPVFAGGNRAAVRADAPSTLRDVLSTIKNPVFRGTPADVALAGKKVAVVADTASEPWLKERGQTMNIDAEVVSVPNYRKGVEKLLAGDIEVLFGERILILGALGEMDRKARDGVVVLDRLFTHEPAAFPLERNDDGFRLLVDRALSETISSEEFVQVYRKYAGELDEQTRGFFAWHTLAR
jgi:polar amino acid transport system substrate-binding protein